VVRGERGGLAGFVVVACGAIEFSGAGAVGSYVDAKWAVVRGMLENLTAIFRNEDAVKNRLNFPSLASVAEAEESCPLEVVAVAELDSCGKTLSPCEDGADRPSMIGKTGSSRWVLA
jgi:hypothetical protein